MTIQLQRLWSHYDIKESHIAIPAYHVASQGHTNQYDAYPSSAGEESQTRHQTTSLHMLTLVEHRHWLVSAYNPSTVTRGSDINLQDFPKLIPSWFRLPPGFRPLRRILQRGEQGEAFPSTLIIAGIAITLFKPSKL
jgi:hypothetical protein